MSAVLRLTTPTRLVLTALLRNPAQEFYGRELMTATGLEGGTLYMILQRLLSHGWLASRWEDVNPSTQGRPPRRYVRLTAEGITKAQEALDRRAKRQRPGRLNA